MKSYVEFERDEDEKDEYVAGVVNKSGDELGRIYYKSAWRKFVFDIDGTFFDADCMAQIASHLSLLSSTKRMHLLKEKLD